MNVEQLIEKLKTMPPAADVLIGDAEGNFFEAVGDVTKEDFWGGRPGEDARIMGSRVFIS